MIISGLFSNDDTLGDGTSPVPVLSPRHSALGSLGGDLRTAGPGAQASVIRQSVTLGRSLQDTPDQHQHFPTKTKAGYFSSRAESSKLPNHGTISAVAQQLPNPSTRPATKVAPSTEAENPAVIPLRSVATALSQDLGDSEYYLLSDHQQMAITELGVFSDDAQYENVSMPLTGSTVGSSPAPYLRSMSRQSDESLRATLGHDGFNQLSFLAAWKRHHPAENARTGH